MRRPTGLLRLAALMLVAASQLTACAPADARTSGSADSLYIGMAANRRAMTEAFFEGALLAIDHLNASRPDGTPPFALLIPPDSLTGAVEQAVFFRDDPRVVGVVGHTGSAQTREAAPIHADVAGGGRRALVAVAPIATNPGLTRLNDWIFRVCPTDDDAARALARFAADSLGARRAAVIYRNDLFGRGFTRIFAPAFAAAGGDVLERNPYLAGITEYDAYASRLGRRRADLVVFAGSAPDAVDMIRAMRRAGAGAPVIGTDNLSGIADDPQHAREFAGVRFTAFYLPGRNNGAQRFESEYRARHGRLPEHRAALAYDAAMVIGIAAQEVGADRRKVRDRIARTGNGAAPHPGVTGEIRFSSTGDAIGKPVHMGVIGGGR